MKRANAWLNRIYAGEAGRWLLGAAVAAALYLLAATLQPVITFYDNDDLNIAWALAGYRSGAPSFSHPFINPMTAAVVSGLYALLPAVPWWYAVQTACMLLGVAVMAACTFKLCHQNGAPLFMPLVLLALICSAACYYAVSQVMFTLSSTLLGMGAVALALALQQSDPPARRRFYRIAGVALLALSLLIRQSSGLCAACFYFGALAIRLMEAHIAEKPLRSAAKSEMPAETQRSARHPSARSIPVTAACALLAVLVLASVNGWGRANQNPAGFIEFENARAAFMDYPHDTYYENPELYESLGWDDALYGLVDAWFYMDARVNAETLSAASARSHVNAISAAERVRRGAETFAVFLGKYPIAVYLCVITLCAAAGLIAVSVLRRSHWLSLAGGCCMLLGAAALTGFLLWQGRINLRTLMTIAFPAMLALLLLAVCAYGGGRAAEPAGTDGKRGLGARAVTLRCVCGALAAVSLFCGYKIFRTVVSYDSAGALEKARGIVDYARGHPEHIFIRDVYVGNNYDALTVYPDDKPINLIDWGGCDMYTRARAAQWRANGYAEGPYADVFFDDGVYYVCDPGDRYLQMLDTYLQTAWDAAGYEIVDRLPGGAAVVRFLR